MQLSGAVVHAGLAPASHRGGNSCAPSFPRGRTTWSEDAAHLAPRNALAATLGVALVARFSRLRAVKRQAQSKSGEAGCPRRSFFALLGVTGALPGSAARAEHLATLTPETLKDAKGKVVVITGATAGVGLEAARTLVAAGAEVYVTGRTLEKAKAAVADITKEPAAGKAIPLELNLASLSSVRAFASQWSSEIKRPIDILACNAGLALGTDTKEPQLTADGYELTVGTNHLGHFLLVNLLEAQLAPSARIVVTASSVHNPKTGDPGAQATLGDLSGLYNFGKGASMVDGGTFDAQKAYKDSKLCNVLFTLELARRLKAKGSKVTVNCFSPGLIPSPTFFRYQSSGFSSVFAFAANNILKIAETPQFGGETLVFMALDPGLNAKSGLFYSAIPPGKHVFVEDPVSDEARNEKEAADLWKQSAVLVGL